MELQQDLAARDLLLDVQSESDIASIVYTEPWRVQNHLLGEALSCSTQLHEHYATVTSILGSVPDSAR